MTWFSSKKNVVEKVTVGAEVTAPVAITLEFAVRFIVENKYEITRGRLSPLAEQTRQSGRTEKDIIRKAVENTTLNLQHKTPSQIAEWVQELEGMLVINAMMDEITDDLYSDVIEAARSRAMVKALRAGLDKSEAFLKLVEETNLKEIRSIERWIERSDAYQAVTA